ncbi:membrane fusion protein, cobalt-zinc-cadmium efflux system [Bradyrhizobium erythrophlei]|jgi:cobalt-zinc-cadmium efflux system membrane fusion protein|nr:membrane fusion protein, cobalt-zinc-cadmium efflux system [Bradyrhizobium erythrophlei]SIO67817.1 membrane fusion protein, cobalt-zinc-cadmium efflux system [Bradyrhizobium erythrophlei]
MALLEKGGRIRAAVAAAGLAGAAAFLVWQVGDIRLGFATNDTKTEHSSPETARDSLTVDLSETQLAWVRVEPVREQTFPVEKEAVGTIQFNTEVSTDVFTPYPGRIIGTFARIGDDVKRGATLFTIDSPDLLQAESTLISTAGTREFTTRNLARLKELYTTRAISQKDLDQVTSDQQAAEGALRAARNSVRLFGKSEDEIDRIIAQRMAESVLVVPSPISGRITARNAAPGLYVQPGNAPAPFTVSDIESMWMLANVAETDSPAYRLGQAVQVSVNALPGRTFYGKITKIGELVDPTTRRVLVRSEIANPQHELKSGMFANFVITVGQPVTSPAVPMDGVVREGDGTMTVWVTADRRRFTRRTVKIGSQRNGARQILEGVQPGELVATEGALFLSNSLASGARS